MPLLDGGTCRFVLTSSPPGHQTQLQDPACPECQNHDRPKDHGEEQRYRKRELPLKEQEVHLDGLEVLKDEDEDYNQDDDADDERRPGSAQAGLTLTRQWRSGLVILA